MGAPYLGPFWDTIPALAPPPGVESNLVDPPSLVKWLIIAIVLCLTLSTVSTIMRVITRLSVIKFLEAEDYALIIAEGGFVVYCGLLADIAAHGAGRHQWDISVNQAIYMAYFANIIESFYGLVMFSAKVSLLLQIKRIFSGNKRGSIKLVTTLLIWANGLFYLAGFLANIFSCNPRIKIWEPFLPGYCLNIDALIITSSAINGLSDLIILILPMVVISRLNLPSRRKLAVAAIFATGLFAFIACILRMVASIDLFFNPDVLYGLFPIALWALAELSTVIICGCLPCVPQFISLVSGKSKPTLLTQNSDAKKPNQVRNIASRSALRTRMLVMDMFDQQQQSATPAESFQFGRAQAVNKSFEMDTAERDQHNMEGPGQAGEDESNDSSIWDEPAFAERSARFDSAYDHLELGGKILEVSTAQDDGQRDMKNTGADSERKV